MMCSVCGTKMAELFTSSYCPVCGYEGPSGFPGALMEFSGIKYGQVQQNITPIANPWLLAGEFTKLYGHHAPYVTDYDKNTDTFRFRLAQ